MGHRLPPPPKSCSGPWGGSRCPSAANAHRGTWHYCSTVLVMLHQCSTCTPAVLQPGVSRYLIWGPQILVPQMSPCILFQSYGSELSPRLGPVPWPDEPSEGTILTQPLAPAAPCCAGPGGREQAGRQPGTQGCSAAVRGQCGCVTRSGPWGAWRWARSPAAPTGGRKSLCCRPAGTYVCLEAPAPKLLLLICNPPRAGGKGIRGINGLTVTTTIISSGCLGQALNTHARGCPPRRTDTHKHADTCPHPNTSAHADAQAPTERSTSTQVRTQAQPPACTPAHTETRTPRRAHPQGYTGWNTLPLARTSAGARKEHTNERTPVHAHPLHTRPRVCAPLHPCVPTRAPAHPHERANAHTRAHTSVSARSSISAINLAGRRLPWVRRESSPFTSPRSLTN